MIQTKGVTLWTKEGVKTVCLRPDWNKCKEHKKCSLTPPNMKSADTSWADDFSNFSDPFADAAWDAQWEQAGKIAGYDKWALGQDYGISYEEISQMELRPAKVNIPKELTTDDALWEAYNDGGRKKYLSPEIQAIIVMKELERQEKPFNDLRKRLEAETMNPDFPGNRNIGDGKEKSREWYQLISDEAKVFEKQADLLIDAAYQLGLDKSDNPSIKAALRAGSRHATFRKVYDNDGIERTYWSQDFSTLRHAVETASRSGRAKEEYAKRAAEYDDSVAKRNQTIRRDGVDYAKGQPKAPSAELVKARVEHRIAEKSLEEAKNALDGANIFNRNARKKEWQRATGVFTSAKWRLDAEESRG
jgi:hypothetical protein